MLRAICYSSYDAVYDIDLVKVARKGDNMPVIGVSFNNISGTKKGVVVNESISTNSTPKITKIENRDVKQLGKSALAMDFEFVTSYAPDIGSIKVSGELLYLTEKHKEVLEVWKKDKKLDESISVEILNYLFRRCLLKVANLADELQLPLPLRFPIVTKKEKEELSKEDPSVA